MIRTARHRSEAGFSLLELLLAVGILALVGGFVFVDYSGVTVRERLKGAARKLAGYGEMVRAQAVSLGVTCRLEIDFDKSRYRYVIDPPRDEFGRYIDPNDDDGKRILPDDELEEWDASFDWEDLPRDVYARRLVISSREFYEKSTVSWPFWPDGTVASFVLHLSTGQGHLASVVMSGLTGVAEAVPDEAIGFPEADGSDFTAIMGSRAPGAGAPATDGRPSDREGTR